MANVARTYPSLLLDAGSDEWLSFMVVTSQRELAPLFGPSVTHSKNGNATEICI
jgi:hypothetical protein